MRFAIYPTTMTAVVAPSAGATGVVYFPAPDTDGYEPEPAHPRGSVHKSLTGETVVQVFGAPANGAGGHVSLSRESCLCAGSVIEALDAAYRGGGQWYFTDGETVRRIAFTPGASRFPELESWRRRRLDGDARLSSEAVFSYAMEMEVLEVVEVGS